MPYYLGVFCDDCAVHAPTVTNALQPRRLQEHGVL